MSSDTRWLSSQVWHREMHLVVSVETAAASEVSFTCSERTSIRPLSGVNGTMPDQRRRTIEEHRAVLAAVNMISGVNTAMKAKVYLLGERLGA